MPFVEVFIAQEQPPTLEQKRAFAVEAQQIFSEEFGTRPGSLRLAVGMSFYYTDATQATLDRAYHNLWVLRFSDAGQCRSFTEWYMQAPGTP